jgi:multicomponent K+:H+ antiporter subunit G
MIVDALIALSIVIGAALTLIGSIGLVRLGDLYSRLHGPTKATTLGLGGLLFASALYFSTRDPGISVHEILVTLFLFLTAPVSAQMLARAGLHLRVPSITRPPEAQYHDEFPGTVGASGDVASTERSEGS